MSAEAVEEGGLQKLPLQMRAFAVFAGLEGNASHRGEAMESFQHSLNFSSL